MAKSYLELFFWLPRGLTIAAILFLSMFALDSFESGTLWQKMAGFAMHMIPSMVLTLFLILAWRKELLGGVLFIMLSLTMGLFLYHHNYKINHSITISLGNTLIICLPFLLAGVLFVLNHRFHRKNG